MNVLEARVVLRDRSMLDVVDLALRFLATHAKTYARLAILVLPPAFLVTIAVATASGWGWAWTWAFLLGPFVGAPFTALASRLLFEPAAPIGDVIRATLAPLPRLVALRIVELAFVLVSGVLVFPAAWVLALFLFANEVVVLERAGVGAGLARLQRLLSGQTGDAIMAALFLLALHIVAVFLGDAVGRSVLGDLLEVNAPASITAAKGSALGLAAYWLFVPFIATCRFLLYVNVRTRTEGWDVQTRFAALAAREAEER